MLGNQDRKNGEIFITELWRLILQNYIFIERQNHKVDKLQNFEIVHVVVEQHCVIIAGTWNYISVIEVINGVV